MDVRSAGGRATAAALGAMTLLILASSTAGAQVSASGFVGAYDRGHGAHPFFYLAVGGRLSVDVTGPLQTEAEALHVPAHVDGRSSHLFAYRMNLLATLHEGEIEPFVLVGAGWQQWRTWPGSSSAPESRIDYDRGMGYVLGVGAMFLAQDPVRFRVDLRHERSDFPAPIRSGFMGTMSVSVSL